MQLTKTRYCQGIRCPRMMWLDANHHELFDDSKIPDSGHQVGALARELFKPFTPVPYGDPAEMVRRTAELLARDTVHIAEASFSFDGCFCSVDILKNLGGNRVELYEVKSGTEIEEIHLHDAAYQHYVLASLGYEVVKAAIVHINAAYVRRGELALEQLFTIEDITDQTLAEQDAVAQQIARLKPCLTDEPAAVLDKCCFSPKQCGFWGHCSRDLPSPNVFDLSGTYTKATTKLKLYNQGLVSFRDLEGCDGLHPKSAQQVRQEVRQLPPYIDREAISVFLSGLTYPLYFLDFETYATPIPPFDNTAPNEKIVFQYSLHFITEPGGTLHHREHLAQWGGDPRRALAEQLCRDIPEDVCTLAYNMSFEKDVIRKLARLYPDLHDHLMNIHGHIQDLMLPFKDRAYYTREMAGSYSIKKVLPALFPNDPELNYHRLQEVQNGAQASEAFLNLGDLSAEEAETRRKNLKEYCKLDTLAMVRIWEKLQQV